MNRIRISFVLASYNGELFVDAQIRSILDSLGPNDEIIVSDDGSTDGTRGIVEAIDDKRIRLMEPSTHLGYQGNFERAIKSSRGEFIFFSDQDDINLRHRIPESLSALARYDCVCGDAVITDVNLNELAPSFFALRKARFGSFQLFVRAAVIGATMACRREFVLESLPFPRKVPHDMWLSIRAAQRGRLCAISRPFILYRRHQGALSVTATTSGRSFHQIFVERFRLLVALATHRRQRKA